MAERLSELTEQIRNAHPGRELSQFLYLKGRAAVDVSFDAIEEVSTRWKGQAVERIVKATVSAGSSSGSTSGGTLASWYVLTRDWVSLVSAKTVLGRVRMFRVPFQTNTAVENGVVAAYGRALPVSASSLANTASLDRLPIGIICIFSAELFRLWAPASEQNILRVLERAIVRGMDSALLDPDSTSVAGARPASILNGVAPLGLMVNTAAAAVSAVDSLLGALVDEGSDLQDAAIVMHPRTALTMSQMQGSNANHVFPRLTAVGGDIAGIPVLTSVSCVRSGSPPERFITAIDGARVMLADDGELEVDANRATALAMDSAPSQSSVTPTASNIVSMFQTDSVSVKAVRHVNFAKAHASAAAWLTSAF